MTTQEQAEKLAMEAANAVGSRGNTDVREWRERNSKIILSTIPLKEMLDAVELLRDYSTNIFTDEKTLSLLAALDAKLKGKVKP